MDNVSPHKVDIGNHASGRYSKCLQEIERIKNGIYHNRKGQIQLTDINPDPDKIARRVAREGLPVEKALERINGIPNFQDVFILEKILRLSRSVCRINIASDFGASGFGTGFLIAPNLLLTNNHVLPDAESARTAFAQFNYQLNETKRAMVPVNFGLRPDYFFMTSTLEKREGDPFSGLDFTIVAVSDTSEDGKSINLFEYARLDGALGKVLQGENCVVIQHPSGDYKKVVLKDTRMITLVDDFLIYESDTLPGSSGSVVIGMGTGEVIALHHSGVPRRNEKGEWLRRDGTPAQPGDGDDVIDWLGNEGIRISSILKAALAMPLSPEMEHVRREIVAAVTNTGLPGNPPDKRTSTNESAMNTDTSSSQKTGAGATRLHFEVELKDNDLFGDAWARRGADYVPGLVENERLFPYSTNARQRSLFYVTVESNENPWHLAAYLESLPHVATATPDLPTRTDVGISTGGGGPKLTESAVKDVVYDDGSAEWNEEGFLEKWERSVCFSKACSDKGRKDYYRQWNWVAVNFPGEKIRYESEEWKAIKHNLQQLKLTQLDTGYTDHSKTKGGYNLTLDMDFIGNDEDARDEQAGFFLKQPNHGTRTASLVVGGKISGSPFAYDGNRGLLTEDDKALIRLIPYRVSKSVVLIGRSRDMVAAAQHAANNGTDVLFMCMGSYPRPMIEEVVRYTYDRGVIWVCAAGNEVEVVIAPALYPGTIAVAAINPDLKPWKGSSNGPAVDIAAPGESVYVPFWDKDGNEIMCYGNGTSYATPHVASAAMLWKAKFLPEIKKRYKEPWQVVEAFRHCLKATASKPGGWKTDKYGAGILDVEALLHTPLPEAASLAHAYAGKGKGSSADLGIKETVHFLWNTLRRKMTGGPEESASGLPSLTQRGQTALDVLSSRGTGRRPAAESASVLLSDAQKKEILSSYFETQTNHS